MRFLSLLALLLLFAGFLMTGPGCANIVPPGGGPKDTAAPRLLDISPADSQLNVRPQKIELGFNEFVTLNDPGNQIRISPMLEIPLTITSRLKEVTIRIPDTLLRPNTTYRITFGNAIQDLHESNPFGNYTYVFSTGTYFDSLKVQGNVEDAATGLPDTAALVMLYDAADGDSAIVRKKPLYVVHTDGLGDFHFDGLPPGRFNAYTLSDRNANYIYDGAGEKIAFQDQALEVKAGTTPRLQFYSFMEEEDTSGSAAAKQNFGQRGGTARDAGNKVFSYSVGVDTSELRKRTYDINQPLRIRFSKPLKDLSEGRVFLSYDSAGTVVEAGRVLKKDSTDNQAALLTSNWREDMVYTLRLLKGFAVDTAGTEAMPSRYSFHTKRDEDYGKLQIHLPTRVYGSNFILQVTRETDTIYQKPVTDTMITFKRLAPGTYSFRVIHDDNRNSSWDRGDLFLKKQPEKVEAYPNTINLKAGWENMIDFEERSKRKALGAMEGAPGSPGKR